MWLNMTKDSATVCVVILIILSSTVVYAKVDDDLMVTLVCQTAMWWMCYFVAC